MSQRTIPSIIRPADMCLTIFIIGVLLCSAVLGLVKFINMFL